MLPAILLLTFFVGEEVFVVVTPDIRFAQFILFIPAKNKI
jgi:hypothetical protein